jgi:hypothetical protein
MLGLGYLEFPKGDFRKAAGSSESAFAVEVVSVVHLRNQLLKQWF